MLILKYILKVNCISLPNYNKQGAPEKIVPSVMKVENDLKGYMHMLVISAKGNKF